MIAIIVKELRQYYFSSMAWAFMGGFFVLSALVSGVVAHLYASQTQQAAMAGMLEGLTPTSVALPGICFFMGFFLLFLVPLLTMRLFAGEQRSGTLELLMHLPLSDWQIVLGKYIAGATVVSVVITLAWVPLIYLHTIMPWELVTLGWSFIGMQALGWAITASGLFASVLTSYELVAAVIGSGISLVTWLQSFFFTASSSVTLKLGSLSLLELVVMLSKGDWSSHIWVIFIAWILLFLGLTLLFLDSRKWIGWER